MPELAPVTTAIFDDAPERAPVVSESVSVLMDFSLRPGAERPC